MGLCQHQLVASSIYSQQLMFSKYVHAYPIRRATTNTPWNNPTTNLAINSFFGILGTLLYFHSELTIPTQHQKKMIRYHETHHGVPLADKY